MAKQLTLTIDAHELPTGKYKVHMVRSGFAYVEVDKDSPMQAYTLPEGDFVPTSIKELVVSNEGVCTFKANAKGAPKREAGTSPSTFEGKVTI